jgi:plastocyanin
MLTKRNLLFALTLALIVVGFTAYSRGAHAHIASIDANEIVIQNFAFVPSTLTIKAGEKVTWVNRDDEPHTATANDKSFNSKTLENGERFSTEFRKPGTYQYYCALHPKMTAQIIVK